MAEKLHADRHSASITPDAYGAWAWYFLVCALPAVFLRELTRNLFALIQNNETYSHIALVPAVTLYLIWTKKEAIFSQPAHGWKVAGPIAFAGAVSLVLARFNFWNWEQGNQISLFVLGLVLLWAGAFGIFHGEAAMRSAVFPLAFLLFAIPIPAPALSEMVSVLQRGSAEAVNWAFRIVRIPFVRQGFNFALPGVTIQVAEECSGIRSTLALVMSAVLAGHLWLRSVPRTFLLCLATIPIAIAKNALRITVLSWLAVYVNLNFLFGSLHRYGGIPFFGLGLVMIGLVLMLLQRKQTRLAAHGE